jgi:hypothetical protein
MPKRRSSVDITAEMEVIRNQINELVDAEGTDEEIEQNVQRSQELLTEIEQLDTERKDAVEYEKRVEAVRSLALMPKNRETGDGAARPFGDRGPEFQQKTDPFDANPRRLPRQEVISRAMTAIDDEKRVPVSDSNKAHLEYLIHRSDGQRRRDGLPVRRRLRRPRLLLTENKMYRSAFKKYARLGTLAQYSADEQRAISEFQDYEITRAASENTTTAGGFGVPVKLAA